MNSLLNCRHIFISLALHVVGNWQQESSSVNKLKDNLLGLYTFYTIRKALNLCFSRISVSAMTRGVCVWKLKERRLERRVIGDRCDRYGRSGVRGIRSEAAKPTKLGTTWTAGGEPADMKETQTLAARQLLRGFRWQTNSYLASTSTPLSNSQVHTQRQLLSTPYLARSDFYFLFVSFLNTFVLLDSSIHYEIKENTNQISMIYPGKL